LRVTGERAGGRLTLGRALTVKRGKGCDGGLKRKKSLKGNVHRVGRVVDKRRQWGGKHWYRCLGAGLKQKTAVPDSRQRGGNTKEK